MHAARAQRKTRQLACASGRLWAEREQREGLIKGGRAGERSGGVRERGKGR